MKSLAAPELKRKLRDFGFDIYRTLPDRVILAERVRDNLIMDSGIAALVGADFSVQITIKAQQSHYPGEDAAAIRRHASSLAAPFLEEGYRQAEECESPVMDPSNPEHKLDTCFEVKLRHPARNFDDLTEKLRAALAHPRASSDDIR